MVTGKAAHVDDPAAGHNIMSPSTQSSLLALLAKLEDKDPNCRKTSLEAIKELMQRDIVHDEDSMTNFMDTLLGTLDKKSKHSRLVSSSDQGPYSQLAHSSASLLAAMATHATHQHIRLSPHHIASIVKHLVSWFPLDLGTASQTHSLHQACSKLVISLAENAALHVNEDITKSLCSSPSSFTHCSHDTSESNDSSTSSSSRNIDEDPSDQQQCASAMESLCRPLITALCNKVEPISRGATTCLEALVSMDSWRFVSPSLIEELCFRAVNVMQERTVLSTTVAQMRLLCSLAKKNHESLSCFRAGLLKKGVDILLNHGAWQQRVAAARMLECLLSMGSHAIMGNKHDKQAVVQAIEALEHCKRDKVAMVRSAVMEALKKAKPQHGLDQGNALSTPGEASTSSCSTMKAVKVDYRKRRRKKPSLSGPLEKQPAFSSPALSRTDPLSGNDRWINRVTPSSGWSSSDSVNSSVDVKCPKKKVARTVAWNGKTNASERKNGQSHVLFSSSPSTISPSLSSLSAATAPSVSSSCSLTDMMNRSPSLRPRPCIAEETMESASHAPHMSKNSLSTESNLSHKLEKGGMELFLSRSEAEEEDVYLRHTVENAADNHACGPVEEKCNSCATPTNIHYNPIAQLESLEEAEIHKSVTKPEDDFSASQISLLLPKLGHTKLQYTDVLEGIKRIELLNDVAWNVRNNPIATDDSELDSPRSTVFDSCSVVYCADGDDDDTDVNIQVTQPEVKENRPVHAGEHQKCDDVNQTGKQSDVKDVHARGHQEGDNFVNKRQHGRVKDDDGFVDHMLSDRCCQYKELQVCGTDDGRKQQAVVTPGDHIICNNARDDSHNCEGDVEAREKLHQCHQYGWSSVYSLSEGSYVNQLSMQEDAETLSAESYETCFVVPKEMPMKDGEIQEHDNTCSAFGWHNVSACKSVPKMCCSACQRWLFQASSAESCTLKGSEGHCTPGSCTLPTEDAGIMDDAATMDTAILQNQMSNHEEPTYHVDDPHPLLAINEHEGIGDNFDVLTRFNDTCQVLYREADWESSRNGHRLEDRVEDMQALKPAMDMESVEASSLEKRFACGEEDECRGDPGEESGNSVVGWLRECYVVKKLGGFGILFLGLTIPLAIVSIISTFDTKEEASDFLVPT